MEQFGDYLVRRLVGEGGMGKVYEGEEKLSKRRVAIKVLHPELAKSDSGRKLFVNEMQILAHLEHPNIVRSLSSIEANGQLAMILEFLEGRTLRNVLLEDGRQPWAEAVRIVSAVAAALSAAHGQEPPIIHRDLKPENIMILKDGNVKVMDFGIAKMLQAMNQTNTQTVGTLQYMSPEQIDARTIDHRADLYSLGLIFYELLSGKPPFYSASPRQLLNMQCTEEAPPLEPEVRSGLPKGVEQLVFQLLEKAPEDRPFQATDVVERLEPFQVSGPAPTKTAGPRASSSSSSATTPHDKPSTARNTPKTIPESAQQARSVGNEPSSRPKTISDDASESDDAPAKAPRNDTIALVDKVGETREIPNRVAIGIIVGLSLAAGLVAYWVRSAEDPETTPAAASASTASPFLQKTKDDR
jgi:serine/threonine protein kinase